MVKLQEILQKVGVFNKSNERTFTKTTKNAAKICSVFSGIPCRFSLISRESSSII
nr:MAG TPA: hypothetical protein [Caudoviricetes sp.]